jgi:hypothetical protein
MASILHACRRLSGHFRAIGYLFLLVAMGGFAACHPPHKTKQAATLSPQDSLLGAQYPLREEFQAQKDLLYKLSKPAERVIVPDGEYLAGNFASGVIELIFDEIDGEPFYFFGHLPEANSGELLEFIVYMDIPDKLLNRLVPGQPYRVFWIETVVSMVPFDEDRYRNFVVYRIEEE